MVSDNTPKIKGPIASSKFNFSFGKTVIQLCIYLKGNINFKNVGMIKCNKYACDARKTICFSVKIENKTFIIMD